MIIPSIDIMGGKVVQLRQGKEKALERDDPVLLAKEFSRFGEVAVVDLDAALGKGDNESLVMELCRAVPCRVGGGIRSTEKAIRLLRAGARRLIIGTSATPEFLGSFPKERVIVALDSRGGKVVDKGWVRETGVTPLERLRELEPYCGGFLYTDVEKEGMMGGFDREMATCLRARTSSGLTLAGGICSEDDVAELQGMGIDAQIGMAVYTGAVNLPEAFASVIRFGDNGLCPTAVMDVAGRLLMLAFSSRESLKSALRTGKATYLSRSRDRIWVKGETSGNSQVLLRARYDCDRDAVLFVVDQEGGGACHLGGYSCFGDGDFRLEDLSRVITERLATSHPGSYTAMLAGSEPRIVAKIREESEEVCSYAGQENLVAEIADLTYAVMVLMEKKGITNEMVLSELWRRRR